MTETFFRYLQFEKRLSSNTLAAYQNDIAQFSEFLLGNFHVTDPGDADYGMIRSWIISLVDKDLEPISINRKIACLRTFYKYLLAREFIVKDPTTKVSILKSRKKLPSFVKEGEMMQLLDETSFPDTVEGLRNKLILELFYATGIRLAELIGLKESQVDVRNCTIKVLGKRNKERVIPFSKKIVPILEAYRTRRNREIPDTKNGLLFVTNKGEPCYPMMIYRTVKKYLMLGTVAEKKSPHILRHTYATHLLNKGAEINAVKDLLGHSSLAATQVYTHNSIDKLKRVFDQAHPKA
ncbi:MAG TPA: tyrosine-type recombinase/integrase [Chryseolinea sp.]|nr:tyrosine-type recombinase/integrase [Chryseolinea sp.]